MYSFSSSFRYRGPRPFSTLKTKSILKSILADTGSQCKLQNKYRCNVFISASGCYNLRTAEFCSCCSLLICDYCRPDETTLQWSNFSEIKEWVSTSLLRYERNILILAMLRRWKKAALQMLFICISIETALSSRTSMFLADLLGLIISAPIRIEGGRWREFMLPKQQWVS